MINLWILQTMHALKPSYNIEIIWAIFGHLVTLNMLNIGVILSVRLLTAGVLKLH